MLTEAEAAEDQLIVDQVRARGLIISSVWDLVHAREAYPEAIPVLIRMLPKVNELGIKEGIIRALSIKAARPEAAKPLIEEFRKLLDNQASDGSHTRWAIANALTVVATSESTAEILHFITLPSSGNARQMLALTLGRLKDPRAIPVLIELLKDDHVVGHAASALGMMKAAEARPYLLSLTNHPRTWIRKEAEKAVLKLDGKPVTKKARMKIN